jgi:hypothetical protein
MTYANFLSNELTGIGGRFDAAQQSVHLSKSDRLALFNQEPIVNKVIRFYPEKMARTQWQILSTEVDLVGCQEITKVINRLSFRQVFCSAQIVANIFGSSKVSVNYNPLKLRDTITLNLLDTSSSTNQPEEEDKNIIHFHSFGNYPIQQVGLGLEFCYGASANYQLFSLLTRFWQAYKFYKEAVAVAFNVLARKDVVLVRTDLENETDPESLIRAVAENGFNLGVLLISLDTEIQILSRDLGGLSEIIDEFKALTIAASEMSEVSLFGFSSKGSGLANVVDKDRDETNAKTDALLERWVSLMAPVIDLIAKSLKLPGSYYLAFDKLTTPDFDPQQKQD